MFAGRPITNVEASDPDQTVFLRLSENAFGECASAQAGK
jgi:hypothetical protein